MKITLYAIGKTDNPHIIALTETYVKRLKHYVNFTFDIIPDIKNVKSVSEAQQKIGEGNEILKKVQTSDFLCILDEKGTSFSSEKFAVFLQKKMNSGLKNIVFVVGGPYGFSEAVYARANSRISLSSMTFSHQMVRLFFIEQVYRGYTILKNEPYHHK
jgi:23S rRNA (pseudouridine1915-N3)-methyltransferase